MSPPLGYAASCVPRALAALTDLSPRESGRLLWGPRHLWWERHYPGVGADGAYGTPELAVPDVLVRLGWGVEQWGPDGRLTIDPEMFPTMLATMAHDRVSKVRRHGSRDAEGISQEIEPEPPPERRPLTEWIRRHPVGRWIYYVADEANRNAHAVAVAYGDVLAGDTAEARDHGTWGVYIAHRIFPPLRRAP